MTFNIKYYLYFFIIFILSCNKNIKKELLLYNAEKHFKSIKQLTFDGNNAEGYFSFDDQSIIFQSDSQLLQKRFGIQKERYCDQIFTIYIQNLDFNNPTQEFSYRLVSTGKGRTTCSFFLPDNRIIYASTHHNSEECPESFRFYQNHYVWQLFDYDIYLANQNGSNLKVLVSSPGYDAEAVISPDGKYMVYTSTKSGDLELWRYDLQTGEELQLTNELGYDGGAFFSQDSKKIVWRASRPRTTEEIQTYKDLLRKKLVQPTNLNIFVMDIDGKNKKQITHLPGANWAPYFHPNGYQILFSSNHHTLNYGGRVFNIFMINIDGTNLEQITFGDEFEAFPFFSYHQHKGHYWFLFSSNRKNQKPHDTNLFIAEWVD
jgi:TolB protein